MKKWIDLPDLKQYEQFVTDWHYYLKELNEKLVLAEAAQAKAAQATAVPAEGESGGLQLRRNAVMTVLNRFYREAYDQNEDFYQQFYQRLEQALEEKAEG